MAYKIKSMLKQTSGTGLSANYYLKQELNKFTDGDSEVVKPSNKGKSIAKATKKFTTPELIKAQVMSYLPLRNQKDTARERDEKKQIREAGREAAKNAEVDFVKATPMGSDYFSLMAATAENIASRAGQKRKARKAAKEMKREMLSKAKDTKSLETKKPLSIVESVRSKVNDRKVPKKATDVVPFNWTYEGTQKQGKAEKKKESDNKKERDLVESINEAKLNTTPPGISGIGRTEIPIATPPFPIPKEQQEEDREYIQKKRDEDLKEQFKGTGLEALFMMGDGFSKGMSRKNKYKK